MRRISERPIRHYVALGVLLCGVAVVPSCGTFPNLPALDGRTTAQEGELTLRDGEDSIVPFKKVFAAPPRMSIVELRQSTFTEKRHSRDDFRFLVVDSKGFRIVNNHPEANRGSFATIKWRAEGVLAAVQPTPPPPGLTPLANKSKLTQDDLVDAIKRMGGTVGFDMAYPVPPRPINVVDLHHTKVSDADLEQLRILAPRLRSLTLNGTGITDEGMKSIGQMPMLQTLVLSETRIGDAGLQQLQRLTEMRELSLYHARVTDEGLAYLKAMKNLNTLLLSGRHITDRGLMQLAGLRNLRHLTLSQTNVSKSGADELKKLVPHLEIVQ